MTDLATESLSPPEPVRRLQIFHARDARQLMEVGLMSVEFPPEIRPVLGQAVSNGLIHGDEVKVLFNIPGFSLLHAWLKKDYPLSIHTHDTDCLYWIVSGALQLGRQTLHKGDGFFVPADVPYSYVPTGENGVEVLEFRHAVAFNFKSRSKQSFWIKAAETCRENSETWKNASSPLNTDPPPADVWAATADRFWKALDEGNVEQAMACCDTAATTWHNFDRKLLSYAESEAAYRQFVTTTVERATTQVRRVVLPDGLMQQHVLAIRMKAGQKRLAWAICLVMRFRAGKIASIEEYLDRQSSFDPDATAGAGTIKVDSNKPV